MSTEYYLKSIPEQVLKENISIKVRRSLIKDHNLKELLRLFENHTSDISDETVRVLNRGIRGPYLTGSLYCGFNFQDEFEFWREMVEKFPNNSFLNMIYADYIVQKEKGYKNAHPFYQKAFELNYRMIFAMEPSWRDELIKTDFKYEIYYLKTQKDDYDPEDFNEVVDRLKAKYLRDKMRIEQIETIANNVHDDHVG